jgi:putative SOS response-associated peptidase YedK
LGETRHGRGYPAPIVRNSPDGCELTMARWGMPTPPKFLVTSTGKTKASDPGVTNIRNAKSPRWRRWLGPGSRCLVPFNSFSENELMPDGSQPPIWFVFGDDRPLSFFVGIWTPWVGVRKVKEGPVETDLFGSLTTEPNALVGAYHPKAMPVILTTSEECDTWFPAPAPIALALQRPLEDEALIVVAWGSRQDGASVAV